mmetsp:Transcript_30789/g.35399  ORF Transcript_30789/g.35399 Transcript_30789/m.35399 type:complete len:118 (+) Transcript_30789:62-415(+)
MNLTLFHLKIDPKCPIMTNLGELRERLHLGCNGEQQRSETTKYLNQRESSSRNEFSKILFDRTYSWAKFHPACASKPSVGYVFYTTSRKKFLLCIHIRIFTSIMMNQWNLPFETRSR